MSSNFSCKQNDKQGMLHYFFREVGVKMLLTILLPLS